MAIRIRVRLPHHFEYGEYGGPEHSGERRNPDGSLYKDADGNTQRYYYQPKDGLDEIFRYHDMAYDHSNSSGDLIKADLDLIRDLINYDPYSDPSCTDPSNAAKYKNAALGAFVGILLDEIGIPGGINLGIGIGTSIGMILDRFRLGADATPPRYDPLILDLDGDGLETVTSADGAFFDHDGNGFAERTGWVSGDDGLLVRDINNDGIINNGGELFGDQTLLSNGQKAAGSFQALADLDINSDGKIDANDSAFAQLKVWQDIDGDGYSTADELKTLSELGITALNTGYTSTNISDGKGNTQIQAGTYEKSDNSSGQMGGFLLQRDTAYTIPEEWLEVPAEIAALPDIHGYGNVYDLQQSMVRDTSGGLQDLVELFVAQTDAVVLATAGGTTPIISSAANIRNSTFEQILFKWTGSDGIDPGSRGGLFDARRLAVLEKLLGQDFVGTTGADPNVNAVLFLNQAYQILFDMLYGELMMQTHLKDAFDKITYNWNENTQSVTGDLSAAATYFQQLIAANSLEGKFALAEFVRAVGGLEGENNTTWYYESFKNDMLSGADADQCFIINSLNKYLIVGDTGGDTLSDTANDDAIAGGDGNDNILSIAGNDVLYGGKGNDILYADQSGSGNNILLGGDGNDSLFGSYMGSDRLDGGSGDDVLTSSMHGNNILIGGTGNDTIYGRYGNDTIDGGAGSDHLSGGGGNDVYYVDNTGDKVSENANEGADTVLSSITYTLTANVENLTLTGTAAINGTGNTLNNILLGNNANNTLSGGSGADTMKGGLGNDLYYVDNIDDIVTEYPNEGTDTVRSSVSITLGSDVENLILTGTSAINGIGNELNNVLTGNSAVNTLSGGAGNDTMNGSTGADTMIGGLGNDVYYVDNLGDVVTEGTNEGTDTVYSSISYTLNLNVENLTLIGTATRNGTGNSLDNVLTGNIAVNVLTGNGGNDTIDGGAGNDSLAGGTGSDTYLWRRTDGKDMINETAGVNGDIDTLRLMNNIRTTDPVLVKQNNDLYVFVDANNYMKIVNEFQQTNYGIERLEVSDGHYVTRQDIQTIVDTMSSINNNSGMDVIQKFNAMISNQTYQSILAQSWHQ
jgi:Ca2+-binding RTX toxin-like protein